MGISIFKVSKGKTTTLDSAEAFNIWNLLTARYISVEAYTFMKNFVHDRELLVLIYTHNRSFKKQIEVLEKLAQTFKVKCPERPPTEILIKEQIPEATDRLVFRSLFSDILAEMYALSRSIRTTTTNDNLLEVFIDFFYSHINNFANLYKLGKLRGWTDVEPAYKTAMPTEREQLSVSEAVHIWDHINTRYDQIELTDLFLEFVHDIDFQLVLKRGLPLLEGQINTLEKLALKYDVPLPERPPAKIEAVVDPEAMEDKFVYRVILAGIQAALDLHTRAVIETIRNDSLRKVFVDLLQQEIKTYQSVLKYGKAKGWTRIVPMYQNKS